MSRRFGLLAVISVLVVACGGQAFNALDGAQRDQRLGHWLLDSGTLDGADIVMVDGHPITMTLDGSRVGGRAACNSYGGSYTIDESGAFTIVDGLAVTEMWCGRADGDDTVMRSEAAFLTALQKVDKAELTGSGLVLTGGGAELRFVVDEAAGPLVPPDDTPDPDEPVDSGFFPASTLGSWTLVSGELDGRIIVIVDGYPVLLTLGVNSFGGTICNHYGFAEPFPEDGSFPEIASTLMACDEPVMESEAAFLEALGRYRSAEVVDGQLVIRGEGTRLVFDRVSGSTEDPGDIPGDGGSNGHGTISNPASMFPEEAAGEWMLVEGEYDGGSIVVVTGHPISLTVAGQELSGKVCNEYWGVLDGSGRPTEFATTRMACQPDVMESESLYLKALAQGEVATIADGRLIVRGAIGFLIFERH